MSIIQTAVAYTLNFVYVMLMSVEVSVSVSWPTTPIELT